MFDDPTGEFHLSTPLSSSKGDLIQFPGEKPKQKGQTIEWELSPDLMVAMSCPGVIPLVSADEDAPEDMVELWAMCMAFDILERMLRGYIYPISQVRILIDSDADLFFVGHLLSLVSALKGMGMFYEIDGLMSDNASMLYIQVMPYIWVILNHKLFPYGEYLSDAQIASVRESIQKPDWGGCW